MGYKTNSPCKQVWLPLDYDFIFEHTGHTESDNTSFRQFAFAYKEKYGIDLHDIFELKSDSDRDYIYISLKVDVLSSYNAGTMLDSDVDTRFSNFNSVYKYEHYNNSEPLEKLIVIGVGVGDLWHGFTIMSNGEGLATTLDDLYVILFEI